MVQYIPFLTIRFFPQWYMTWLLGSCKLIFHWIEKTTFPFISHNIYEVLVHSIQPFPYLSLLIVKITGVSIIFLLVRLLTLNNFWATFRNKRRQTWRETTTQKMKFSIKDFFSKYDQIRCFLRIWSYLRRKSLMENFIFCAVMPCVKINAAWWILMLLMKINFF